MSVLEIIVAAYLALVPPILGALFVRRFDRMDKRLDELTERVTGCATLEEMAELSRAVAGCATREEMAELSRAVAGCATREEMAELSRAVAGCATREEMAEFRREVRSEFGQLRKENAALRSDLTQVALAVGARPRASEG